MICDYNVWLIVVFVLSNPRQDRPNICHVTTIKNKHYEELQLSSSTYKGSRNGGSSSHNINSHHTTSFFSCSSLTEDIIDLVKDKVSEQMTPHVWIQ